MKTNVGERVVSCTKFVLLALGANLVALAVPWIITCVVLVLAFGGGGEDDGAYLGILVPVFLLGILSVIASGVLAAVFYVRSVTVPSTSGLCLFVGLGSLLVPVALGLAANASRVAGVGLGLLVSCMYFGASLTVYALWRERAA